MKYVLIKSIRNTESILVLTYCIAQ